jgi:hypothetical protein
MKRLSELAFGRMKKFLAIDPCDEEPTAHKIKKIVKANHHAISLTKTKIAP